MTFNKNGVTVLTLLLWYCEYTGTISKMGITVKSLIDLDDSRRGLQMPLPIPLKPGIQSKRKM